MPVYQETAWDLCIYVSRLLKYQIAKQFLKEIRFFPPPRRHSAIHQRLQVTHCLN